MIKASPQLMDRVSENETGFSVDLRNAGLELDVCPLRLVMNGSQIRSYFRCTQPEAEFGFEVFEMIVRPWA